jgi:hypothetical protein
MPMTVIARLSGLMAAGLLVVAIGFERFVNAMLVDGIASYTSTRFIMAVVWVGAGTVLLVLNTVARRSRRRPRRYECLK